MKIVAAPGRRFPREGAPRSYIEATPVEVPESAYYLRALADGDVELVQPAPAPGTPAPASKESR